MSEPDGPEAADAAPSAEQATPLFHWRHPAAFAIVFLSIIVYLPSVHGSKIWDDTELLGGRGLGSHGSIASCFTNAFLFHYYRPLTSALFVLDHRLWDHGVWGASTLGYHVTNMVCHAGATGLLIPILLLAFRKWSVALLGAFLFAVQPAQVSAVAWIGGRTDTLCTLCIAVNCLALLAGARSTGSRRRVLLACSAVAYAAAVLAKEQALVLVPLAPAAILTFRPITADRARLVKEAAGWAGIYVCIAGAMLTCWLRFGAPLHPHWNIAHQLALVPQTIDYYFLLLVTPTPMLNHLMTLGRIDNLGPAGIVAGCIIGVCVVLLLIRLARTDSAAAWWLAGCVLLLTPVSNLYPMTTQVIAPYRAATAGFFAAPLLALVLIALINSVRVGRAAWGRWAMAASPALLYASYLCVFTTKDAAEWRNSLSASLAVERYDSSSMFGQLETANACLEFGELKPAITRLDRISKRIRKSASGEPMDGLSWQTGGGVATWAAGLYGRAGLFELAIGDTHGALEVLAKGEELDPKNEQVNAGLANYLLSIQDFKTAEVPIRNVLAVEPGLTGLRMRLGKILLKQERWSDANIEFSTCLSQAPNDLTIYLFTALARLRSGDTQAATAVLDNGLKRHVLDSTKLHPWLASIGAGNLQL